MHCGRSTTGCSNRRRSPAAVAEVLAFDFSEHPVDVGRGIVAACRRADGLEFPARIGGRFISPCVPERLSYPYGRCHMVTRGDAPDLGEFIVLKAISLFG